MKKYMIMSNKILAYCGMVRDWRGPVRMHMARFDSLYAVTVSPVLFDSNAEAQEVISSAAEEILRLAAIREVTIEIPE